MAIKIKSPKQNYIQSITGPQFATISGSTITYHEKYPLIILSGGFVAETNTDQRYTTLSIDTSLIDLSAWSQYAANTDINAGGNKVINVSNPTNPNDAVNLQTLENTIDTELSGWATYTASTNPNIGGNRITNVADPTDPNDAVNLQTLQNEVSNWSSHAATSTPNMGGNRITNVAEPVTNTDAATRGYVDSLFTGTVTEEYHQVVVLGGSAASGSSALEFQVSASSQPLENPLNYNTGLSTTHTISASLTDQNKTLWAVGSGGYVVSRSLAKFGQWEEVAAVSTNYPIDYKCITTDNSGTIVLAGKRTAGLEQNSIVQLFFPTATTMNAPLNQTAHNNFTGSFHAVSYVPGNNTFQLFGQNGMYQVSGSGTSNAWSRKGSMPVTQSLYAAVYDEYTDKYWVVGDGGVVLSSSNNTPISGSDFIEVAAVSTNYPINYRAITTNNNGTIVLAGKRTSGSPDDSIVRLVFPTTTTMNAPDVQTAPLDFYGSLNAISYVPQNDEFVLVGQQFTDDNNNGYMIRSGSDGIDSWTFISTTQLRGNLYTIAQRDFSSYGGSNWAQYPAVKNVDINGFSIENVSGISTANDFAVTASNIEFVNHNTSNKIPVFDNTYTGLPSGVNSIMNGLALLGNNQIEVGTYTPTCSGSLRAKIIVPYDAQYIRIGPTVFVTGRLDVSGSSTGAYNVDISLPVASYFNNVYKANGLVTAASQNGDVGYVRAVLSSNVLRLEYIKSTNYNAHPVAYMAVYEIA